MCLTRDLCNTVFGMCSIFHSLQHAINAEIKCIVDCLWSANNKILKSRYA